MCRLQWYVRICRLLSSTGLVERSLWVHRELLGLPRLARVRLCWWLLLLGLQGGPLREVLNGPRVRLPLMLTVKRYALELTWRHHLPRHTGRQSALRLGLSMYWLWLRLLQYLSRSNMRPSYAEGRGRARWSRRPNHLGTGHRATRGLYALHGHSWRTGRGSWHPGVRPRPADKYVSRR